MELSTIYKGAIIHSINREKVTILENGVLIVQKNKVIFIDDISSKKEFDGLKSKYHPFEIVPLRKGQFLIPGFIDTHTHASQFPNMGVGYDKTLLEWLGAHTFPLESKFVDRHLGTKYYREVIESTLENGTTTAVYFATIHLQSSIELAKCAHNKHQRAFVGKVNMDSNCPLSLQEDLKRSIKDTTLFIKAVTSLNSDLVKPIITPRFALSCSAPLLGQLGSLAELNNLHIQTHLAETVEERDKVAEMFPEATNYTSVYERAGLLTNKTILAHCIHLDDYEMNMIHLAGSSVAHCPSSNINLKSGLCNVRKLLNLGINVSLGTDVAGGNSVSMLDAMRSALNTSVILSMQQEDYLPLSYHEVFYMATMGGAKALKMDHILGNFRVGKFFDALLVSFDLETYGENTDTLDLFQKFIYTGDNRAITRIYVDGKLVQVNM
uniref:Guanine deaminase n=1 Tax=Graphocephala atropunctata TaxID=36148 RepID=A0A1B6M2E7_9HEMI